MTLSENDFDIQNYYGISFCSLLCTVILLGMILTYITAMPMQIFIITLLLICVLSVIFMKKNKTIATLLTLQPIPIPFNRIYIGNMDWNTMIIRIIPIIGNIYDLYKMLWDESLVPADGWTNNLFDGIPLLENIN